MDSVESPDSSKLGNGGVVVGDGESSGAVCNCDKRVVGRRQDSVGERVLDGGIALGASSTGQMQSIHAKKVVHITEEKVFAMLGDEAEKDFCRWVLDTGASNHMLGCEVVFSSIDDGMIGTVKFIDEFVVKIEGLGTILYECKDGKHHSLTSVYFIP
jgi:hypothetical protein